MNSIFRISILTKPVLAILLLLVTAAVSLAQDSGEPTDLVQAVVESELEGSSDPSAPARWLNFSQLPQLVQQASVTPTLLAGGSAEGLDQFELSTSASITIPDLLFESESLFSITPSVSVMNLAGPTGVELPSELYRVGTTFGWMKRPNDKVSYSLGLSPSAASDFQSSENGFRMTAHAMVSYQRSVEVQYVFGAAYLNRNDISILPMAGMIWTPSEELRVELSAPRPRIARRFHERNVQGASIEDWFYLAGEFGGGTWAVERESGGSDELTIRDFRIVLGYENQSTGRLRTRAEMGYVFGRKLEYESDDFAFEPDGALMMRANFSF